jgi:hypothetical protein
LPSRYQKEIEEILEKVNDDTEQRVVTNPVRRKFSAHRAVNARNVNTSRSLSLSPLNSKKLLLAGLSMMLLGVFLNGMNSVFAPWALWGSILLLSLSYTTHFIKKKRRVQKRWRGEVIDDSNSGIPFTWKDLWRRLIRH